MTEPAAPSRRSEASAQSRERILDAAEMLFAEQGFAETSLVDVANQCGISRGSIPWHFTNKSGLLLAVIERAASRDRSPIPPGVDGLKASVDDIANRLRQPSMALLHALLGEASQPGSDLRAPYARYHEQDRDVIASWLASSPSVERLELDESTVARLVYALVIGIHVQWRIDPNGIDLEADLRAAAHLLSHALGEDDPE